MGRTWREEAAHLAGLISGVLDAWRAAIDFYPSHPRQPWNPLGGWWSGFRDSLLADNDFSAWANAHIIQPLELIDPMAEDAPKEVGKICARLNRLVDRLRDGGRGSDLVWEVTAQDVPGKLDQVNGMRSKSLSANDHIVQAVRELAEWGRLVCETHLPALPYTLSLSMEARQLAISNWESTCIALIPIFPVETLSVLRTWDGIPEPVSRLMIGAIQRHKGPMLPDTLRQVDEWLALQKPSNATSSSDTGNGALIECEPPEFAMILSLEQWERCSPVKRAIARLAPDGGGTYIPTPKEVWNEDGLLLEDLARLADKSDLRDHLHDLGMLARTINLQSKRTGYVPDDETEKALELARKIRGLVAGIGENWKKYAQDVFVSPLEAVVRGEKAEGRMYDVCVALRGQIDLARKGLVPVDSRPRATSADSGGVNRMKQMAMLSIMPKSLARHDRYQNAGRRWPWRLENGNFEIPPWLTGKGGESSFRTVERCLLWLLDHRNAVPAIAPTGWQAWEASDQRPDYLEARASEVLCATDCVRADPKANEVHMLLARPSLEHLRDALAMVQGVIASGDCKAAPVKPVKISVKPGSNPMGWTGGAKLKLLEYLLAHPLAQQRKVIEREASKAGAGKCSSIQACLVDLKAAGWLREDPSMGTCLSEKGERQIRKKLRKN